jgi:hypothetical protein
VNAPFLIEHRNCDIDLPVLAFAWRGACLELYSVVESTVCTTVDLLADQRLIAPKDGNHAAAGVRMRALVDVLRQERFDGHERRALKILEDWEQLDKHRIYFAHGRSKVGFLDITFTIEPRFCGARQPPATRTYDALEMLALLRELSAASTRIRQQLGQINAYCRRHVATLVGTGIHKDLA